MTPNFYILNVNAGSDCDTLSMFEGPPANLHPRNMVAARCEDGHAQTKEFGVDGL